MATRYISVTAGNDTTGTGTLALPWKTLSKAMTSASVGDTVQMRGGTYPNTFTAGRDTVIIENYPGELVIISRAATGSVLAFENSRNITIRKNASGGSLTVRSSLAASSGSSSGIFVYMVTAGSPGFVPTNITIDGVIVRDINGWGIQIKDATNVVVQNCDVSLCGTGLRYQRVTGSSFVQDSVFHDMNRLIANTATPTNDDNGATGVAIDDGCQYVVVRRNLIYECHATSFDYGVDGGAVELYACGGTGAVGTTTGGCVIEDNICYNNEGFLETGTGNSTTYPMRGNIVRRNLVYGKCSYDTVNNDTPAMYLRAGTDLYVYNNTFDIDDGGGIINLQGSGGSYGAPMTNTKVKNNIIVSRKSTVRSYELHNVGSISGLEVDYNLVHNTTGGSAILADDGTTNYAGTGLTAWRSAKTFGDNDIWNTDPLWTDRTTRDYSLTASSPARNAGAVLGGTTTGYAESSPDIGAYEYSIATLAYVQDTFTRTVASGFGTATIGGAWTTDGTAANAAVNGTEATMTHSAAAVNLGGFSTATKRDVSVNIRWKVDVVPVGGAAVFQTYLRKIDVNNFLRFVVKLNTGSPGTVTGAFEKSVAGVVTTISAASTVTGLTAQAGVWYYVRAESTGSTTATAKGRVWYDGTAEPVAWLKDETYTDAALMADGAFEFRSQMATGATSLPSIISADSIMAIDLTPLDVTAPAAPIWTNPTGSVYNTSGNVVLAGTAEADSSVEIFDGATSKGSVTAVGGNWTMTIANVTNGAHVYTAKAKDDAGNVSVASASRTVTVDTVAPTVTVTSPLGGATSVAVADNITATFSEAMDPLSVNDAAFQVSAAGVPVAGVVTYGSLVATFNPTTDLAANTLYTAALDATVNDVAGVALVPKSWTFTTGTSGAPAAPVITTPAADSYDTDTSVTVAGTSAASATITLYDGATNIGSTTASGAGAWTFSLTSQPEGVHTYSATATVSGAVSAASAIRTVTVDLTSPVLASTYPQASAISVAITTDITVAFSEAMNPATISGSTFTVSGPSGAVAGTVTYDAVAYVARFHPTAPLVAGATYTVTLTTAIADLAGRAIP